MTAAPDADGVQMKIIWNSDLIQDVIDALDALVSEAKFHFLDGLIRIWVIDPANVGGCYIDLDPDANEHIQHYSVQEGGFTTGLNIEKLDDIMGYADPGVPVQFEFGEKHKWRFNITLPSVDVNLSGIDPDSVRQEPDHPRLGDELPAHYTIEGSDLKDAVDLNDMFSDHCTIRIEDHQVKFIAQGDTDDGTYSFDEADGEVEFTEHPDEDHPDYPVESMFSLDYFEDLAKVLRDYETVQIASGQDYPVMLKTDLFDYMLAPRIDSTK